MKKPELTMDSTANLLPVLERFGLDKYSLSTFLQFTQGFIAGGAVSSAFFEKELDDTQDLDIWIPGTIPYQASSNNTQGKYSVYTYKLIREYVYNYFTKVYQSTSIQDLLNMKLDELADKYPSYYKYLDNSDISEYKDSSLSKIVKNIDVYENPWTHRRIQVMYLYDLNINNPLDLLTYIVNSFDLNVCQFYTHCLDYSTTFQIKHSHSPSTLFQLREGKAQILCSNSELNEFQKERLEKRVCKYENRGYSFSWSFSNKPYRKAVLQPAPLYSFYQDFDVYTSEIGNTTDLRKYLHQVLEQYGCHFEGSDTEGNLNFLVKWLKKKYKQDKENGDEWRYTFRFTWDANKKNENIYIRHMLMMNPY